MANVVARLLVKMKLIQSDKVLICVVLVSKHCIHALAM